MKIISLCILFITCSLSYGNTITIGVASNFSNTAERLALLYEKKTGIKVTLLPGASGKLFFQIKNGAPIDLLLSADEVIPFKLANENLGVKESIYTYAIGKLVLWSNHKNIAVNNSDILKSNLIKSIAISNPKLAPFGIAANEVLKNLSLNLENKIVYGENVAKTYQLTYTLNADIGFVALSQVKESKNFWVIPQHLYSKIKQNAIILSSTQNKKLALNFLNFLKSNEVKIIIKESGYDLDE